MGYWSFDYGDGRDESGNGNDGTLYGDTIFATGQIGSAMSFDGDGDYVSVANDPDFDLLGDMTYSLWLYPRNLDTVAGKNILSNGLFRLYHR